MALVKPSALAACVGEKEGVITKELERVEVKAISQATVNGDSLKGDMLILQA